MHSADVYKRQAGARAMAAQTAAANGWYYTDWLANDNNPEYHRRVTDVYKRQGCNLGMFYKRRDYTRVVNGRNPIVAHEYLGESVEGKTVFIADDIIASGESMLEVASNLKERGAARIIANATFPLFTSGLAKFDQAVAEGKLTYVVGTNLTYRTPERCV